MKPLYSLFLFLGVIHGAAAQVVDKNSLSIGLSGSASILEYSVRGHIEPFVSWGSNKKQILLAPTILAGSNLGYQSPQTPRLTGARFGYRFWPGTLDKKWEFHLTADIRVQRTKDLWDANFYNQNSSEYQEFVMKTVEVLIENYLGYGLVFNINKSFNISQGVGLGYYISNLDTRTSHANASMADLVDYRGYDNIGFVWNVRFEVAYTF